MMIDFLKLRTDNQDQISILRNLEGLIPDFPKKGRECLRLSDRIKIEFRPIEQYGNLLGYHYADLIIFPHYIFNEGKHNGNDFPPIKCIKVLREIFNSLGMITNEIDDYKVVNIEFGVNVIPQTNVKAVVGSIKYWKRKPFVRNKAKFSLITKSSAHKQIKAYAKGIDDIERIKSGEIDPNTFRWEIKSKEKKFLKLTAKHLLKTSVYEDFQKRLLSDLSLSLFIEEIEDLGILSKVEINQLTEMYKPESWQNYLNDKNRDKFNYQRKKYEKICSKVKTIKSEIEGLIRTKFNEWENSANSMEKKWNYSEGNHLKTGTLRV